MKNHLNFDPSGLSRDEVIAAYWDLQADFILIDAKYQDQTVQVVEFTVSVEGYLRKAFLKDESISREKTGRMLSYISDMREKLKN